MLLSDGDIRNILGLMDIATEDSKRPFKPDEQIQPASIDLRLDGCFWVPLASRRKRIDLLSTSLNPLEMQRLFERRSFRVGERITLKPGELILGRTFERFTIPNGYAGKLEGRSTFARLGLSIHCTGDFINPGWRGKMPLQLVNHGRVPIILGPYIDICQLLIVKTTSESQKAYGSDELSSKYMNEDGEPSRLWMDARLKRLREAYGRANLPDHIHKEFARVLGKKDVRILDRFTDFLHRQPFGDVISARDALEMFVSEERRRRQRTTATHSFFKWLPFSLFALSMSLLFKQPYTWGHIATWVVTTAFLVPGFYFAFIAEPPGEYLLQNDLDA